MMILVSHVIAKHIAVFEKMSSLVTWHIPHEYSPEMKNKSTQVL